MTELPGLRKKIKAKHILFGFLAFSVLCGWGASAQAQDRYYHGRRGYYYDRDWRDHEYRARRYWHRRYYYPGAVYAPPVVYPPYPYYYDRPGFNLVVPLDIH